MHIKRIVLRNVRGLRELEFDLARPDGSLAGWHVITGDNASGKTTLLKAISIALVGPDVARILQPSVKGWVRDGESECLMAVEIVAGERDSFATGRPYERPFWSEVKCEKIESGDVHLASSNELRGKEKGPTHGPWAENPVGWFSAGYGPFRRLYGASSEAQRIMSGPSRIARFATMFREDATLGECELWLTDLKHKELEGKDRERRVLQQVLELLNTDFLRNGLTVDRVDSEGLWLRDSQGVVLPLSEMSEGYRASLALLVDVIRHMVHTYGDDNLVVEENGRHCVMHPGVVLIDEIDSHLHPEWQRSIGFWLKEHFPNCQFLVTTHSAIICQAADWNGIFHLPSPGSGVAPFRLGNEDYQKIIRSTADPILLSPAFAMQHTRSPLAVRERRRFTQLRSKEQTAGLTESEQKDLQRSFAFIDEEELADVQYAPDNAVAP